MGGLLRLHIFLKATPPRITQERKVKKKKRIKTEESLSKKIIWSQKKSPICGSRAPTYNGHSKKEKKSKKTKVFLLSSPLRVFHNGPVIDWGKGERREKGGKKPTFPTHTREKKERGGNPCAPRKLGWGGKGGKSLLLNCYRFLMVRHPSMARSDFPHSYILCFPCIIHGLPAAVASRQRLPLIGT